MWIGTLKNLERVQLWALNNCQYLLGGRLFGMGPVGPLTTNLHRNELNQQLSRSEFPVKLVSLSGKHPSQPTLTGVRWFLTLYVAQGSLGTFGYAFRTRTSSCKT